jgi:hypothetical protein
VLEETPCSQFQSSCDVSDGFADAYRCRIAEVFIGDAGMPPSNTAPARDLCDNDSGLFVHTFFFLF